MVLRHFIGCIEQAQHRLTIVHSREKDHELDIDCDQVEIKGTKLKVDGDVERDLAGIDRGEQL